MSCGNLNTVDFLVDLRITHVTAILKHNDIFEGPVLLNNVSVLIQYRQRIYDISHQEV